MQAHLASVQRHHFELAKVTGYRIQLRQVKQTKIIAVLVMTADPFVVIDKITTTVQDQLLAINLHRPGMVRGMSVHKIDSSIDQAVRKAHLFRLNAITPVGAPMC